MKGLCYNGSEKLNVNGEIEIMKCMRKQKYIINFILIILSIGMILLNLFFVDMPRWIGAVLMLAIFGLGVWLWIGKKKLALNIVMTVVNVLTLIIGFVGVYCNPYWNSISFRKNVDYYCLNYDEIITYEDALCDLDYAMKHLEESHPLFISGLSDDMEALYETARENLKSYESITANILCKEIQQFFSSMGDGHTYIFANFQEYHYLKHKYNHDIAGDVLVGINNRSIEELFEEKKALFSYETESYGMNRLKSYLSTVEDLDYLGINLENGIIYTYETAEGERVDCTYYREDFVTYDEYMAFNNITDTSQENEDYEFVSYEIIPECDLAVLVLYSCNYNDEYKECLKSMFTEVKEKGINNVCVDLGNNGGGNSLVANEFIRYLDINTYKSWGQDWRLGPFIINSKGNTINNERNHELLFTGNVYALTSVFTYSSAMDFAMLLTDNNIGTIIGEASGNRPGSYGDITVFKLQKSGLVMQVSTKKWYRVDTDCLDEFIEPDIKCESGQALEVLKLTCKEKGYVD